MTKKYTTQDFLNLSHEIEKSKAGQTTLKDIKYVDKDTFEHAKRKVLRDFDTQFRSLSRR